MSSSQIEKLSLCALHTCINPQLVIQQQVCWSAIIGASSRDVEMKRVPCWSPGGMRPRVESPLINTINVLMTLRLFV